MASQIEICNQALTKIGASRVISIDDDVKQARALKAIYNAKRDAELAAHPWTFAITRAQLPASVTAPAFGWARAFPLPADCLQVVEVGENYVLYVSDTRALFQIEARSILCDEASPLNIRYVRRETNDGLFAPLFAEALACRLAAEIAEELTQSSSKREQAWKEHKEAIRLAKRANAIEQPPQPLPDTPWWLDGEYI